MKFSLAAQFEIFSNLVFSQRAPFYFSSWLKNSCKHLWNLFAINPNLQSFPRWATAPDCDCTTTFSFIPNEAHIKTHGISTEGVPFVSRPLSHADLMFISAIFFIFYGISCWNCCVSPLSGDWNTFIFPKSVHRKPPDQSTGAQCILGSSGVG